MKCTISFERNCECNVDRPRSSHGSIGNMTENMAHVAEDEADEVAQINGGILPAGQKSGGESPRQCS